MSFLSILATHPTDVVERQKLKNQHLMTNKIKCEFKREQRKTIVKTRQALLRCLRGPPTPIRIFQEQKIRRTSVDATSIVCRSIVRTHNNNLRSAANCCQSACNSTDSTDIMAIMLTLSMLIFMAFHARIHSHSVEPRDVVCRQPAHGHYPSLHLCDAMIHFLVARQCDIQAHGRPPPWL